MFTVRGVGRREDLERGVRCAAGVLLQAALRLEQVRALRPQGLPSAAELAGSFGCCLRTGSPFELAAQHEGAALSLLNLHSMQSNAALWLPIEVQPLRGPAAHSSLFQALQFAAAAAVGPGALARAPLHVQSAANFTS